MSDEPAVSSTSRTTERLGDVDDVLVVLGAALVVFGVWSAWPPLGYVAAGAFLFQLGRARAARS